jgi:hypothetical protein
MTQQLDHPNGYIADDYPQLDRDEALDRLDKLTGHLALDRLPAGTCDDCDRNAERRVALGQRDLCRTCASTRLRATRRIR